MCTDDIIECSPPPPPPLFRQAAEDTQPEELCPAQQWLFPFDEVTYAYQVVISPGISPCFGKCKLFPGSMRSAVFDFIPAASAEIAKMARVAR